VGSINPYVELSCIDFADVTFDRLDLSLQPAHWAFADVEFDGGVDTTAPPLLQKFVAARDQYEGRVELFGFDEGAHGGEPVFGPAIFDQLDELADMFTQTFALIQRKHAEFKQYRHRCMPQMIF